MNPSLAIDAGRRRLLAQGAALAGVALVGLRVDDASAARLVGAASSEPVVDEAALTAWVRITPRGETVLVVSQAEIGQGISTTLRSARGVFGST